MPLPPCFFSSRHDSFAYYDRCLYADYAIFYLIISRRLRYAFDIFFADMELLLRRFRCFAITPIAESADAAFDCRFVFRCCRWHHNHHINNNNTPVMRTPLLR